MAHSRPRMACAFIRWELTSPLAQVDINTNVIKKHKMLKKRLTEDALDDQLS